MELNTTLLTGFVKKLRILDKEFRSTQAAQEYVEKECAAVLAQQQRQAMEQGDALSHEGLAEMNRILTEHSSARNKRLREYEEQKTELQQRLGKCRLLLAGARNVSRMLVDRTGTEKPGQSEKVELETLLSGKTDLIAMAGQVNELFREGRIREGQAAAARFEATRREAERLLTEETARLASQVLGTWNDRWELTGQQRDGRQAALEEAEQSRFQSMERWTEECAGRLSAQKEESRRELAALPGKRAERIERITSTFLSQFPPSALAELWADARDAEPDWGNFSCTGSMPERLCLAGAEYDLSGLRLCPQTLIFLEKNYPFLILGSRISIPWGLELGGEGNYEFKFAAGSRERAVEQARAMALRMIAMMPPGRIGITFVDPVTLGESFAPFGRLADAALGGANGRIWSSQADVERQLGALTEHITRINQRCLQGRFATLAEYNRESGREPEGYRVLMLMDYPAGLSEQGLKRLEQIVRHGPKCGVFTIVWRSEEQMKKLPDKLRPMVSGIRAGFRLMRLTDGGQIAFELPGQTGGSFLWRSKPAPTAQQLDQVFSRLWMGI